MTKVRIDHSVFNILAALVTIALVWFVLDLSAQTDQPILPANVLSMVTGMVMGATLYLLVAFVFFRFLHGYNYDILKEIFEQNNIAAGIFCGLLLVGLAMAMRGVLM